MIFEMMNTLVTIENYKINIIYETSKNQIITVYQTALNYHYTGQYQCVKSKVVKEDICTTRLNKDI